MSKPTDIELSVGLSVDDVAKSTAKLAGEIKNIFDKSAGKKLDINLQRIKKSMADVFSETNKVVERMRELEGKQIPTAEYELLEKRIEIARRSLQKFQQMQQSLSDSGKTSGPAWDLLQSNIERVTEELKEAQAEMDKLVDAGAAFTLGEDTQEYADLTDKLALMNNKMRLGIMQWDEATGTASKFQAVLSGLTKILSIIGRSMKSTFSTVVNLFKKGISAAKKFVSAIASIPSHFRKASAASNSFNGNLKRGITSLLRYGLGIASLATLFNKLRAAASEGIKNLVLWEGQNGKLNKSISMLQSSIATLKNSIGAMVAPLINSLAPAIARIIDLITIAIQKISMFIAALTGQKTYLTATKVQSNYAASLDKTAGSAAKAKKALDGYLGTFDELNNVNSKDDSGGGGGAGGGAGFKETPIDQSMLDLLKKLKDMWKLGDFTELGKWLGEKLRDFLESIPWDKIQETARRLGSSLATLINGFVEVERLGYDIGYTLAQSINTVFHFLNEFVHKLHWDSIGKFIADTFNGFFETIDWPLIKDTVITGMRGLADAIWAFIKEFHWDNISNFIKNGLDTIAKGIKAFFEQKSVDENGHTLSDSWAKTLGEKLGKQLQKVFEDKELWREVGEAIGDLVQGAIDFASGFVDQLNADDIVASLTEMVNGFFDRVDSEQLGKTLAKIINLAIDVAKGFWAQNKDTLKQEGQNLVRGFLDEIDTEDLMSVFGSILKTVFVVGAARAIPGIIAALGKLAFGKIILDSIKKQIGTSITEALAAGGAGGGGAAGGAASGELLGSATAAGTSMGAAIAGALVAAFVGYKIGNKLVGPWLHPDDKELYENFRWFEGEDSFFNTILGEDPEILKSAWSEMWGDMGADVKEAVKTFAEEAAYDVQDTKNNFQDLATSVAQNLGGNLSDTLNSVKGVAVEFATESGTNLLNMKDNANEAFEGIRDKVSEFGDAFNEKKEAISTAVSNIRDAVVMKMDEVGSKFTACKDNINIDMSDIQTSITGAVDGIKSKFGEWASDLGVKKDDIKNKLGDLKNHASESFENMKTKVSEFATNWAQKFTDAKTKLTEFNTDAKTKFKEIQDSVVKCFDGIKDKIRAPINSALGFVEKLVNGIINAFNGLGDKLGGLEFDLPDWLPGDLGGKHFELKIPKLNTISIPKLAQGAVIPPNKEFLAMLGDQKHGTNIEAPLDTMIEAFNAANKGGNEQELALLREQNDLLRQLLQKEFGITQNDIFRSVVNQNNIYRKSTGNSAFA